MCSFFFFFCPTDRPTFTRGRTMGNETFYWDGLCKYEIARARGEVWRHVTMEAKFLNLVNLSWRGQSFALSNDERIVWTTVLFLSAIIYSKVIHVNFFVFFFSVILEGPRFVEFLYLQSWSKVLGKLLLLTSFSFLPWPWPNVEQNINVCARNCFCYIPAIESFLDSKTRTTVWTRFSQY